MGFWSLVVLAIIVFTLFIFGYKFFGKDALFTLAIGGAVASNIFTIGGFPIIEGNIVFGLDSVIYTLFVFCVIVCYFDYSKKDAWVLTFSAIGSIMFSGIIQFFAYVAIDGINYGVVWGLCSFTISAIATYLAILFSIFILEKLFNKLNKYMSVGIFVFFASLINTLIYFTLVSIINGTLDNFWNVILGSYIGKIMSIGFSVLAYLIVKNIGTKKTDEINK